MSSSTPSGKNSTKTTTKTPTKSKVLILRLRAELLSGFPHTPTSRDDSSASPSQTADTPSQNVNGMADKASNAGTPMPSTTNGDTPDPEVTRKKGGPKAGLKRNASAAAIDTLSIVRGRPGPKKKPRLADGTIDRTTDGTKPAATSSTPAHKLNPKANTGAINANLRALDRTGKPCRKWDRRGFSLKSFTGVSWGVGSWSAPVRASSTFSGDVKSDSSSTGEVKPVMESSAMPSESSQGGDVIDIHRNGLQSSPAPIPV